MDRVSRRVSSHIYTLPSYLYRLKQMLSYFTFACWPLDFPLQLYDFCYFLKNFQVGTMLTRRLLPSSIQSAAEVTDE